MAGELHHSRVLGNFRKPLPACVPEGGLLNLFGGKAFESRRRKSFSEITRNAAKRDSGGLPEKAQPRLRISTKTWNSVKPFKFQDRAYTYNNNEAVTSIYHTVREGETLTSIASQYKTAVEEIASVNHVDNVDIIEAGQLLVVPVHPKILKRVPEISMDLSEVGPKDQNLLTASSVATLDKLPRPTMPSPLSLPYVKMTLLFLFLAPTLAYSIRWLVHSIQLRMDDEDMKQTHKRILTTENKSKLTRWHSVLDDGTETNVLDASYGYTPTDSQENQSKDAYKEICESYAELEPAYLKFLAESGLTRSGYWRGGVPSATSDENSR